MEGAWKASNMKRATVTVVTVVTVAGARAAQAAGCALRKAKRCKTPGQVTGDGSLQVTGESWPQQGRRGGRIRRWSEQPQSAVTAAQCTPCPPYPP